MQKLNILIIGGTGFIGRTLSRSLHDAGYIVTVLSRKYHLDSTSESGIRFIQADVSIPGKWQGMLSDFDTIINLAGASIFRCWTNQGKRIIVDSRINTTMNIVNTLRISKVKVRQLFNISGVGYYGYHGDEIIDENNQAGSDFLARVAAKWEEEAEKVKESGIRLVILRLGHVLGTHGGIFPKLTTLANLRLASRWGSGKQWISWIHEEDLARAVFFLLNSRVISGPVNITSPHPLPNSEMMRLFSKITGKHVLAPPIPEFLLKLVTGEFSSVFVNGQRVLPVRLMKQGFNFTYPDLSGALNILIRERNQT